MTVDQNETPSDRSPFDLPRNYYYESLTDYYINKAEQLLRVKNFELAAKELKGLLECAIRNDQKDLARLLEDKLLKAESLLSQKTESRQFLRRIYSGLQNVNQAGENITQIISDLKTYVLEASHTEEYSNLISGMISFAFSRLNESENLSPAAILKDTVEKILSFDPLRYLVYTGENELKAGNSPFLLFDLDSTLFDNSPRVFKIIQEFINNHGNSYPDELEKLKKIRREDIIWGIKENLNKINITNEEIVNHIIKFWFERFFTNEYIIDLPLRGAIPFVKDALAAGIKIIYLTGRFESMREGTAKNILEHGFPLEPDFSNLLLKPNPKIPDHVFKHEAMERVKKMGQMIGGFDNEPINSNIFQEHFPASDVFFLETNHSLNPPNLAAEIHTIPDFSYLENN